MTDDKFNLEIKTDDVENNLLQIVGTMSKIRAETILSKQKSPAQLDEYLALSYRLNSVLQSIPKTNAQAHMAELVKLTGADKRLLKYDYTQDGFWQKTNPKFSEVLDDVVIDYLGDNLHSMEVKHHLFQAIKLSALKDADDATKEETFSSIQPYNGSVAKSDKKLDAAQKTIGAITNLFGYSYKVESEDGIRLSVSGDSEYVPELLKEAKKMGYMEVSVKMPKKDFQKLQKSGLEGAVIEEKQSKYSDKTRERIGKIIKWTSPISYPILGSFNGKIQKKIENFTHNVVDSRSMSVTSNWYGIVGGIFLGGAGLVNHSAIEILAGIEIFAETIPRAFSCDSTWGYLAERDKVGRLAFALPGLLLNKKLDALNDVQVTALYPVRNMTEDAKASQASINVMDKSVINMNEYFQDVINLQLPDGIQQNLVWGPANHNTFGVEFAKSLDSAIEQMDTDKPSFEKVSDKKNNSYTLYNTEKFDGYTRISAAVFNKDGKFAFSTLYKDSSDSKNPKKNPADIIPAINTVLASNKSLTDKKDELLKGLGAMYVNIATDSIGA